MQSIKHIICTRCNIVYLCRIGNDVLAMLEIMLTFGKMMLCHGTNKKSTSRSLSIFGGEGGDRTRAPVARPNSLANCPLHPLGTSPFRSAFASRFYIIPHYSPIVKRIFLFFYKSFICRCSPADILFFVGVLTANSAKSDKIYQVSG